MKKFLAVLATAISAVMLTIATPASAAGYDWHIFNSSTSNGYVFIYGSSNCGLANGERSLAAGEKAYSWGWDSLRVWSRPFAVRVFDDKTGAELAYRTYSSGTCVNLAGNSYKVIVN